MINDKKLKIANRISFVFFSLYLLIYVFLPIIEKNANYLLFLFLPVAFFIALILNILIKYNQMKLTNIEKTSKIFAILNILVNGFNMHTVSNSMYAGTRDWSEKEEEIKKYPSITPVWLFTLLLSTILNNFGLWAVLSDTRFWDAQISENIILIVSIISIIFILIGMISSTFALYYNNGKKEVFRFWKGIGIVILGLIIISICSVYFNEITIENRIQKKYDKETFERHKQNIERTLNNN